VLSLIRNPAVSLRIQGTPPRSSFTSTISLVVPAIGETIAAGLRAKVLRIEDFPTIHQDRNKNAEEHEPALGRPSKVI
jgi:hypothetical protein